MVRSVTGVEQKNSLEYVAQAFGALNAGNTVLNLKNIDDAIDLPDISIDERIACGNSKGWYCGPAYAPSDSLEFAQILFSSGTEGESKAICVSHTALSNTTDRLLKVMEIDNSIREYIGVPVNFSFGFGRCRAVSAVGGEFYLPKEGFNPLEIAQMLRENEVNAISAVPTLWRLVLQNPEVLEGLGSKVKWIEIGSQYMAAEEKAQMVKLFPNANIVQHYGLTEASRSTFLKIHQADANQLESVGEAFYGVEVNTDTEGRIKIKGPHLATTLYRGDLAEPIADKDGWFTTNDKGRIEGSTLIFEGRMDDIINCGGIKLSPEKIDRELYAALKIDGGIHSAKISDQNLGDTVSLAVHNSCNIDADSIKQALSGVLASYGVNLGSNIYISTLDAFPYTDTGKLKRKALSELLTTRVRDQAQNTSNNNIDTQCLSGEALLISVIEKIIGDRNIEGSASLRSLGADSLSIVQLRMALSKHLTTVPSKWIDLSISELAQHIPENAEKRAKISFKLANLETYIFLRAAAIVLIVIHHYDIILFSSGGPPLLLIIGGLLFFGGNVDTIQKGSSIGRLWTSLAVLIITLLPLTIFQAAMHTYFGNDWHITLLIPYENLVTFFNDITNTIDTKHHIHWLWFIHTYIQIFGFLAFALSLKKVRETVAKNLFASLLIAFYFFEFLALAIIAVDSQRQDIYHSSALLQHSPITLIPLVFFGGMLAFAKSTNHRRQIFIAFLSYLLLNRSGIFVQGELYTLVGLAMLYWWPTIRIPSAFHRPTLMVADASLFIYLTHMPTRFALQKVSPIALPAEAIACIAILAGTLAWPIWNALVINRIRKIKAFH